MRSPFHYFRKHQKVMLAVFGVALMIVFTVGSVILQYLGGPGTQNVDEGTVVTFKGGKLTLAQLDFLRDQHNKVVAYLEEVAQLTRQRNGTSRQRIIGRGDSDDALLHSHLLATKAGELGIVISDQAIIDYLTELSDDKLSTAEFGEIRAKRLGSQMTEDHLFDALRDELAAKAVEEFVIGGLTTLAPDREQQIVVEPSRAWEYYTRLKREITAEILPLKVADYVAEVPEPTEAQVKELYEEFKNKLSFPNDPEPGFRQRDKISLQFVKADYNQLLDEEKAKFSDAEVEQYYRENREQFPKPQLPPETDEATTPSTVESPEGARPEGEGESDGGADAPTPVPSPAPGETQPPLDADQPATTENPVEREPAVGESTPNGTPAETPAKTDGQATENPGSAPEKEQDPAPPADQVAPDAAAEPGDPATAGEGDTGDAANEPPAAADATGDPPTTTEPEDGAWYGNPDGSAENGIPVAYFDVTASDDAANTEESDATATGADSTTPPAAEQEGIGEAETDEADAVEPGKAATGDAEPGAAEPGAAEPGAAEPGAVESGKADTAEPGKAATGDAEPGAAEPGKADPGAAGTGDGATGEAESTDTSDAEPEMTDPDQAEAPKAEPEPEYRSLEEVSDEIRRKLASAVAQERLDDGLEAVRGEINQYYQDRALWEAKLLDDPKAPAPEFPDIESMAKERGLTFGTVPEVDIFEIEKYEIGQAQDMIWFQQPGSPMPRQQRTTLAGDAFTKGLPLYKAKRFPGQSRNPRAISRGNADIQYVYWKTGETEEHVPELKDVREEVVMAWKTRAALKLAKKAAADAARQARQSGSSLAGEFGEEKVIETGATTFYNPMSMAMARMRQGYLQTSEIEGLEGIGEDFLRTVFEQQAGDVCVAVNEPETEVCVVRVKTDRPSREELQDDFKKALTGGAPPGLPYEVQMLAASDVGRFLRDWLRDFDKRMEVDWLRDPRPGSQQGI